MKYIFVFSALISVGYCQIDLSTYPFSDVLKEGDGGNPLYTVHWSVDYAEETITFAVNVSTNGWIGLGISADEPGRMPNSDVVIGWVDDDSGQAFLDVS